MGSYCASDFSIYQQFIIKGFGDALELIWYALLLALALVQYSKFQRSTDGIGALSDNILRHSSQNFLLPSAEDPVQSNLSKHIDFPLAI